MTEPISIGTSTMPALLYSRLNQKLSLLQKEGFPLNIDVDRIGEFTFMDCSLPDLTGDNDGKSFAIIKSYIANCLADIIIDEWEARIIRKIVRDHYFYYKEEEKQAIIKKAKEILTPMDNDSYQQRQRKEKILEKILGYLDLHKELVLEGFINFRLKEYQDELEEIVNSAVDEFLLEKEYLEFVRLLKYFVDIQESRVDLVKIIFKNNGKFIMLDGKDEPLKHESLEGLMVDHLENGMNYDDLLISALITLAPKEVEIHLEEGAEAGDTVKTIQNVFGRRVNNCPGCARCRTEKK